MKAHKPMNPSQRIQPELQPKPTEAMKRPAPPKGYATWLDYAVATMDVRAAQLEAYERNDDECGEASLKIPSYEDMRKAAKAELAALRVCRDRSEF